MPLESFAILVPRGDPLFDPRGTGTQVMPVFRSDYVMRGQDVDPEIIGDIRNFLFGPPGSGGFDLASRNIQRSLTDVIPCNTSIGAEIQDDAFMLNGSVVDLGCGLCEALV